MRDDQLPADHRWATPAGASGWFRSRIQSGSVAIDEALAQLRTRDPALPGLDVQFPGHGEAITSLVLTDATAEHLAWSTWHLYPGADPHVVMTTTEVDTTAVNTAVVSTSQVATPLDPPGRPR